MSVPLVWNWVLKGVLKSARHQRHLALPAVKSPEVLEAVMTRRHLKSSRHSISAWHQLLMQNSCRYIPAHLLIPHIAAACSDDYLGL